MLINCMFRYLNVCSLCRLKHLPVAAGLGEEDCGSAGWKAELLGLSEKGRGATLEFTASPVLFVLCFAALGGCCQKQ